MSAFSYTFYLYRPGSFFWGGGGLCASLNSKLIHKCNTYTLCIEESVLTDYDDCDGVVAPLSPLSLVEGVPRVSNWF